MKASKLIVIKVTEARGEEAPQLRY